MMICLDSAAHRRIVGVLLAAGIAALAGCGKAPSDNSQVVASVAGEEITESQVSHALERQANLRPDQVEGASRRAVSGLVEQAIVLQKAHDLKLDRDERVVQDIEAMKREVIANAYLNRIAEGAGKPSEHDIQAYFDANPELFSQRRVYTFQELALEVPQAQRKDVEAQLAQFRSASEMSDYLKAKQIAARATQSTLAAENVPQALLKRVAQLKPGQGVIMSNDAGLRILLLTAAQDGPASLDKARPAITAYLVAQGRKQAVQKELASLQSSTKVAYFGKYADMAASAPAQAAPAVALSAPAASAALR